MFRASFTYSGEQSTIFPDGEPAPNLVARKISLRFPVRLNLFCAFSVATEMRYVRAHAPFADELFRIAVRVCGVPRGTAGLVDRIEHLSMHDVSRLVL